MRGIVFLAVVLLTATVCNAQQWQLSNCENGVCYQPTPMQTVASKVVAPVVKVTKAAVVAPVIATQTVLRAPVAIVQRTRPVRRFVKAKAARRIASLPVRFVRRLLGCQ